MEPAPTITVLLVDDEPRFREGLWTLLKFYNSSSPLAFEVVGEAGRVEEALHLAAQWTPNLILMDMEFPEGNGIHALAGLKQQGYPGRVLVLSAHEEDAWVFRAMKAGANGYVLKTRIASQLYAAITTVLSQEIYLPPDLAARFFRHFHRSLDGVTPASTDTRLTEREREVLHLLAEGATNETIARQLHISIATVKAHLTAIFEKLKVTSRAQAIVVALRSGLVHP
ncbi:LuxR C-terminal-related transcriptional regulator [Anthocerotibacter panamensis]|uniref:LuxR C-terminal-related transcriptional regulator n=1 Tax=Anthocerotibacter panamensis TaxID=2857077 RepID=UPI001C4023BB|nr:response regulator transcription factor [Anthocerotibacter panamensis]